MIDPCQAKPKKISNPSDFSLATMPSPNALGLTTMFGARPRHGPGMVANPGAWVWCVWQGCQT